MAYLLKLGSYVFPDTFWVERLPMARNVPQTRLVRADGASVIRGYLESKTFVVRGGLVGGGDAIPTASGSLREQLDALKRACAVGPTTFQTHDDRYWRNVQVSSFEERYEDRAFGRYAEVSLEVVAGDPFGYEFTMQTASQALVASGQTLALTVGGDAYAWPTLAVTIAGTGTVAATVTNVTTGESCTLTGLVANGDVCLINGLAKTVMKRADGSDALGLWDGVFPRLLPGENRIVVNWLAGGPSVSDILVTWANRWV